MAPRLPDDTKPPVPSATKSVTEIVPNSITWKAWQEKGKGSSRPLWWLLLLGVLALSVVYWLWGRGPGVVG
jgi:hypothetical protein